MTTGRASEALLDELHALLAGSLAAELKAARDKRDDAGKPVPVPHGLLSTVMKFLKDNGIDTPARSQRMTGLAQELEAIDLDEAAAERFH